MSRTGTKVVIAFLVLLAGCSGGGSIGGGDGGSAMDGADGGSSIGGDGGSGDAAADSNVGVSAGGAQDANAFRRNIQEGYVPQPSDITYEGLYHDYYFDTGRNDCRERFCPTYSRAASNDPLSGETEQFVAVGLTSGITEEEFSRQNVNLIVVLDSSGSMSRSFDRYYYDGEERREVTDDQRKMSAARDAVVSMTDNLGPNDRLGIVEYDNDARTVRELSTVESRESVQSDLSSIHARGGTDLDSGMQMANQMAANAPAGENRTTRVVYVTDAMPNRGDVSANSLKSRLSQQADNGVYTTFVGVGVDFNSELTESISTVRGANYYTVNTPEDFRTRMADGFAFMVTPLAYDLTLSAEPTGYDVQNVYGTPNESPEQLVHVKTLFPSRSSGGGGEGSVILLELDKKDIALDRRVTITASYVTPDGREHETTETVRFDDLEANQYDSTGVRKAVVLTEYAALMRNWAAHERAVASDEPTPEIAEGIEHRQHSQWEQQSVPLRVSPTYQDRFATFANYLAHHRTELGAERMNQDVRLVRRLANDSRTTERRALAD